MIPGPQKLLNLPLSNHKRVESDPTSPSTPSDFNHDQFDFAKVAATKFQSDFMLFSPTALVTQQQLSTGLPKSNQQFFTTQKLETQNEFTNQVKQVNEYQEEKIHSTQSILPVKLMQEKSDNKSATKFTEMVTTNEEMKTSSFIKNSGDKTEIITNQLDKSSQRCDTFGIPIVKGCKKHKLIFDENITVAIIENWKEYNSDLSQKHSTGCKCQMF